MTDQVQTAKAPKVQRDTVLRVLLAQVAVALCCLLAWFLCENVVQKQYSDPVYRTELKLMDPLFNSSGVLKKDGVLDPLKYDKIKSAIGDKEFYQKIMHTLDLYTEKELTPGRIMERTSWGYSPEDPSNHTIVIDVTFSEEETARNIGSEAAAGVNAILMSVNEVPVKTDCKTTYIGQITEPVRTGPNTLLWVIVAGLIAEGIFVTMAFQTGWKNKVNCVIMGFANLSRGQIMRGLLFLVFEIVFFGFMILWGMEMLSKLTTLGTYAQESFSELPGVRETAHPADNSFKILLYGVLTIFFIIAFIYTYYVNIKQGRIIAKIEASGKKLKSAKDDLRSLVDDQFHRTLLTLPVLGITLFTVMPIIFMVLIAFTNYSSTNDGITNLFEWVGLKNFNQLVVWTSGGSGNKTFMATFGEILAWTLIWAFFATFTNYFLGMFVAMAINKKGIKFKKGWRTILVLTIAIPQFISLLYVSKAFANNGLINLFLQEMGWIKEPIKFWDEPMLARITVIGINIWIGIPYLMLITTGILMNIPADLYESARIDGANPWQQYTKITLPYMLIVTDPYLLTSFTGNKNNFNVIYLLTGGGPNKNGAYSAGGVSAGDTDLLITWLFKITQGGEHQYYQASVIGILVFLVVAIISLVVYNLLPSNKNEEDFQ